MSNCFKMKANALDKFIVLSILKQHSGITRYEIMKRASNAGFTFNQASFYTLTSHMQHIDKFIESPDDYLYRMTVQGMYFLFQSQKLIKSLVLQIVQ